jgi:hypothetical protein
LQARLLFRSWNVQSPRQVPGAGARSPADLSHVIAGSADVAVAALRGEAGIPAFIANTIGGVTLVAVLNHAQVREELQRRLAARPQFIQSECGLLGGFRKLESEIANFPR